MPIKRSLSEESEYDPLVIKDEPYIPDDEPLTPPRKKARKPTTPKSGSSAKSSGSGMGSPSRPRSVKCKVILALVDAGLKAAKKDSIAQEVSYSKRRDDG